MSRKTALRYFYRDNNYSLKPFRRNWRLLMDHTLGPGQVSALFNKIVTTLSQPAHENDRGDYVAYLQDNRHEWEKRLILPVMGDFEPHNLTICVEAWKKLGLHISTHLKNAFIMQAQEKKMEGRGMHALFNRLKDLAGPDERRHNVPSAPARVPFRPGAQAGYGSIGSRAP